MNKGTICFIHKCRILLKKKCKMKRKRAHFFKNDVKGICKPAFKKMINHHLQSKKWGYKAIFIIPDSTKKLKIASFF